MEIDLEKFLSVYAANHLKPYMNSDEVVKRAVENLYYRLETQEKEINALMSDVKALLARVEENKLEPTVPDDFSFTSSDFQVHLGNNSKTGESLWHSRSYETTFWSGCWYDRTLAQLEKECISTLKDIRSFVELEK